MSGVAIARALLVADEAYTALVPATKIVGGDLPEDTILPATSIRTVSLNVSYQGLAKASCRRVTERVKVTQFANSYPEQKALIALIRKVCGQAFGTIAGFEMVSVQLGPTGPDLSGGPTRAREQSQDLMISYNEDT